MENRWFSRLAITGFILLFWGTASAQRVSSRIQLLERSSESEWNVSAGLGMGYEALVSGYSDVKAPTTDGRALFEFRVASPSAYRLGFDANGRLGTPLSSPNSRGREMLVEIPELHAKWVDAPGSDTGTFLNLGRKLERWSGLDSVWNLGIWQPLNRFDALRPTEQGLTGAFFGHQAHGFRAFIFASPVYLPEQGPAFTIEDGRFHAQNPWFSPPTDRLIVLNKENQIRYTLDAPSVGSVVNHSSAGALMRLGGANSPGAEVQLAYAHKPRNQLSLPYDGYVDMKSAHVSVNPRVIYHDVYSFDASYGFENWRVSLTSLTEVPAEKDQVPAGLTGQVLGPMTFFSPSAEVRLFASQFWGPKFKLAWLDSWEDGTVMTGPLASGEDSPFGARSMYRKALSLEASSSLYRNWRWSIDQSIRWIEEFAEEGRVVMFDIGVTARNSWRLNLYADLLQSQQPEDSNPGFISRFRGNDRVGTRFMFRF